MRIRSELNKLRQDVEKRRVQRKPDFTGLNLIFDSYFAETDEEKAEIERKFDAWVASRPPDERSYPALEAIRIKNEGIL